MLITKNFGTYDEYQSWLGGSTHKSNDLVYLTSSKIYYLSTNNVDGELKIYSGTYEQIWANTEIPISLKEAVAYHYDSLQPQSSGSSGGSSIDVDLSNYYTKNEVDSKISGIEIDDDVVNQLTEKATKAETAATNAASYLNELKEALDDLPDGSAVSTQVALNTASINNATTKIEGIINNSIETLKKEYTVADLVIGQSYFNFTYSKDKSYTGSKTSSTNQVFASLSNKLSLKKGDRIVLVNTQSTTVRSWGIANTSNVITSLSEGTETYTADSPFEYTAEEDCYLWVNSYDSDKKHSNFNLKVYESKEVFNYDGRISTLEDDNETINDRLDDVNDEIDNINDTFVPKVVYTSADYKSGYRWNAAASQLVVGQVMSNPPSLASVTGVLPRYLDKITLHAGEKIIIRNIGNGTSFRNYVIIDEYNRVIAFEEGNSSNFLTTPYEFTANKKCYVFINHYTQNDTKNEFKVVIEKTSIVSHITELESISPKMSNPKIDIEQKSFNVGGTTYTNTLKVLDIGNSFTAAALEYIDKFISAAGISTSDMCLYKLARAGGNYASFYNSWHNQDSYNGTTGCHYAFVKAAGGLSQSVNGSTALEKMHSALKDIKWDVIIIHQQSVYSADYELWNGDGAGGHLDDMIRILRTYQPQAMIGHLLVHSGHGQSENGDTKARWQKIVDGYKYLQKNYGIDFVIPYGTAIENLRASSLNDDTVTHGFGSDSYHPAHGLARYVATATYFQSLFGKRYGVSVMGNTARVTAAQVATDSSSVDDAYKAEQIAVDDTNAPTAQMCAVLACSDMFNVYNPDDYDTI